MGFGLLPVTSRKGAGEQAVRLTVSARKVSKKKTASLLVSMSPVLFEIMGEPDSVVVFVGDGEDAGTLQIQPSEDSGQKVAAHKGAGVIWLRPTGFVHLPVRALDCEFNWDGEQKALFVTLPESIAKALAA